MGKPDFMALAQAMRDDLVARRRDFHRYPELAFEEVRTSGIVAQTLNDLGLEVQTGVGKTGVVGILEGEKDGPTVLIRADMDALPVQEANETDYISTIPGKMHACGHDGHTAIALGVAQLLTQHRQSLAGRVKFVFQPAEELGAGAKTMIEDGVLQNPKPDVSLGLHLWNGLPVGQFGVASGSIMAAVSDFFVTVRGKGGHGGIPQSTADPVVCAAQIILGLQSIVSRNVAPEDQAVVSCTQVHAGTANNVIPDEAKLSGTFRTFTLEVRDLVAQRIHEIAEHIAASMHCTATVTTAHYTVPVINHPDVTQRVRQVLQGFGYDDAALIDERSTVGEDVGEFMNEHVPGMFVLVGSANAAKGLDYAHHHPRFDIDEDALPLGVAVLAAATADYLMPDVQ